MKPLRKSASIYMWSIVAVGTAAVLYSAITLQKGIIDGYFLLLTLVTSVIGSRIAIRIPKINVNITVDDTFIFIALLLYGGQAAVIISALAGVCAALRISPKVRTVAFSSSALACAVFATATVLKLAFGSTTNLMNTGASFAIIALCLMGLVQYLVHTGIGATASALKSDESVWHMWSRNFLWISISYFSGAAGAGFIVNSLGTARFWAFLVCIPIVIIVYFSYDRYMREVKSSARHAEEAERARAELERQRAEQAEKHVAELNNYIAERERI